MTFVFEPISFLYFLSCMVTLFAAFITWKLRERRGVTQLALVLVLISMWTLTSGLEIAVKELQAKYFFIMLENMISGVYGTLLVFFVIDYFHLLPRFTRFWRGLLWGVNIVMMVLEWTNPWHHLVWQDISLSTSEIYSLQITPGILHPYLMLHFIGLVLLSFGLLLYVLWQSPGKERAIAGSMLLALLAPMSAYLLYSSGLNPSLGMMLLPIGFAITGLALSWIVFQEINQQLKQGSTLLQEKVLALQNEITHREQLELHLRQSQEGLASMLADQSQKLAGLYELILLSAKSLYADDALKQSLQRIHTTIECDALAFYRLADDRFAVFAQDGFKDKDFETLQRLPIPDLLSSDQVKAWSYHPANTNYPSAVLAAGYQACAFKQVVVEEKLIGLMAYYWQAALEFKVNHIALISAVSDELGVIMETARLRQINTNTATHQERRRLARELHDSVTQSLHSLVLTTETAQKVAVSNPAKLEGLLKHIKNSAQLSLKEMRLLLYELRLVSADEIDLLTAIQIRLEAVEKRANVEAFLRVEPGLVFPQNWVRELYPIAMQALNNSLKHARASQVEVVFRTDNTHLNMEIRDNGIGFLPDALSGGGMGLNTMLERAERLDAELLVNTAPGQGTAIIVVLPCANLREKSEEHE